ncbi:MAG: hypothetical protein GMKNLPBB_00632 [Myxococcota bacterium]|nr:hypothetical protein [Myxococcota bacterium]
MTVGGEIRSILIAGAGRAGHALAFQARQCGVEIAGLIARDPSHWTGLSGVIPRFSLGETIPFDGVDTLFIAVTDSAMEAAVRALRPGSGFPDGLIIAHTSGLHDHLALGDVSGGLAASFHPLRALPSIPPGENPLQGAPCAIEGAGGAPARLEQLARKLGMTPFLIRREGKVMYHAAAVGASNLFMALADISAGWMTEAGFNREQALQLLSPLMRGALENLESQGLPGALTGPIRRGDTETVRAHLRALAAGRPGDLAAYISLSLHAADMAEQLGGRNTGEIRALLRSATELRGQAGGGAPESVD